MGGAGTLSQWRLLEPSRELGSATTSLTVAKSRNHFPQFLNSSLKSALFALVILVPLRQTGHLALESLKP